MHMKDHHVLSEPERRRMLEHVRERIWILEFEAQRSRIRNILRKGLDVKAVAKMAVEFYRAAEKGKGWVHPV